MSRNVKPIPENYHGAIPYLNVKEGLSAVEFYKKAFGAREITRILRKDGKLAHGELQIGAATIMLRDEIPQMDFLSPQSVGGTPIQMLIYVNDVDAFVKQAETAGAKIVVPIKEQFHGDMLAVLEDPFGHAWFFAMRIMNLSAEELEQRARQWGI
ncbi:MAG: Glyoxalase/bleomycin resistance protein/dioxygenase [Verrucomicrobiaceae bacterium]|nr:Glyoxalase/bleomycin resistance protein/dioxygenase [Verrucomicrobiaceae bacterium]